jgi:hypothetical protein
MIHGGKTVRILLALQKPEPTTSPTLGRPRMDAIKAPAIMGTVHLRPTRVSLLRGSAN